MSLKRLQPTIFHFDSLPSTNTETARQAAQGAAEGLCIVAREQTRGRGRRERMWASPKDAGLYFSIVLRPRLEAGRWPLLTLAAALAVADALREACEVEPDIKWPNDILARGRKLCGILAETVETPEGRACVVGIGINLSRKAYPPELKDSAISIEEIKGTTPEREALLASLVRAIGERYARLQDSGGAEETVREWSARSSYAQGRRVRVETETESFEGTTRGLESDGALRVETSDGKIRTLHAGDVSAVRA
ncbi:MAG TPA: biotin--[acetyl-CoA-carboxylase] ligase [Pyrinomonadaceae bacterium]|jgi:BirA family biotin operon repressor/biotin-[acetyl-CoA-carboxylase] ligase